MKVIPPLALAHVALALATAWAVDINRDLARNYLFASLVGAQFCLVGLSAGFAVRRDIRAICVSFGILLFGTVCLWALSVTACGFWDSARRQGILWLFCSRSTCCTFALLIVMRWRGFAIVSDWSAPRRRAPRGRPFQFSLGRMMLVATGISLVFGLGRVMLGLRLGHVNNALIAQVNGIGLAVLAIVTLVLVLTPRRPATAPIALPPLAIGFPIVLNFCLGGGPEDFAYFSVSALGAIALTGGSLFVIRASGRRFVRIKVVGKKEDPRRRLCREFRQPMPESLAFLSTLALPTPGTRGSFDP